MDENSCEHETSESVADQSAKETENAPRLEDFTITVDGKTKQRDASGRCGSSMDSSGPSTDFPLKPDHIFDERESADAAQRTGSESTEPDKPQAAAPVIEPEVLQSQIRSSKGVEELLARKRKRFPSPFAKPEESPERTTQEENVECSAAPSNSETQVQTQPRVRMAPDVQEQSTTRNRGSVGPPPSYSFVMKQKKVKAVPSPDQVIIARPPPPTYSGSRNSYLPPAERTYTFPSFPEPIWRSHSQPALCPRCGIVILTSTHAHDSLGTHLAVVALCLFGCWPCCLLPYFMNVCKNTYHHCPICQTFLGLYQPL